MIVALMGECVGPVVADTSFIPSASSSGDSSLESEFS